MLGLGEQIRRHPLRIAFAVGDDQHLRGTGDHVDADRAEDLPFCRRHIGVARPHDLGDGRDAFGAEGKGGNRLRAADRIDFIHAREMRGGEHQRVDLRRAAAGTHMAMRGTPATFAGMAFISTELG